MPDTGAIAPIRPLIPRARQGAFGRNLSCIPSPRSSQVVNRFRMSNCFVVLGGPLTAWTAPIALPGKTATRWFSSGGTVFGIVLEDAGAEAASERATSFRVTLHICTLFSDMKPVEVSHLRDHDWTHPGECDGYRGCGGCLRKPAVSLCLTTGELLRPLRGDVNGKPDWNTPDHFPIHPTRPLGREDVVTPKILNLVENGCRSQ